MKNTYLIIIGGMSVLILLCVWLYLLIYGTPKPVEQFFTDFSFSGSSDNTQPISEQPIVEESQIDISPAKLRQLTTRPVIGYSDSRATSSDPRIIRYVEGGTGHVFSINMETGEETRVSNNTIPNPESAVFSPDNQYVLVRSGFSRNSKTVLINLSDTSSNATVTLDPIMDDFTFADDGSILYTTLTSNGTSGYKMYPDTKITTKIFDFPFQEATMVWSRNDKSPHYVYPKTSTQLRGYLYSIKNGKLKRETSDGLGLTAEASPDYIVSTVLDGSEPASYIYDRAQNKFNASPIIFEPHKCILSSTAKYIMYCGYEITEYGYSYPNDWYQGARSFSDNIWSVNLFNLSATQLTNPENEVGRVVDITNMETSSDGKVLYFTNKNDNTLWSYEI